MKQHKRWDEQQKKMVTCQGSGLMPSIIRRYPPPKLTLPATRARDVHPFTCP